MSKSLQTNPIKVQVKEAYGIEWGDITNTVTQPTVTEWIDEYDNEVTHRLQPWQSQSFHLIEQSTLTIIMKTPEEVLF